MWRYRRQGGAPSFAHTRFLTRQHDVSQTREREARDAQVRVARIKALVLRCAWRLFMVRYMEEIVGQASRFVYGIKVGGDRSLYESRCCTELSSPIGRRLRRRVASGRPAMDQSVCDRLVSFA